MSLLATVTWLIGAAVAHGDVQCHVGGEAGGSTPCATLRGVPSIQDRVARLSHALSAGELVALLAPMSLLYPSSTPAWAMEWDPASREFRVVTAQPAPVFTERATTLGAGALLVGVTYQDVDFQKIDGRDIRKAIVTASSPPYGKQFEFRPFESVEDIELHQRITMLEATYGLLDRLDLDIVLPIIRTEVGGSSNIFESPDSGTDHVFVNGSESGVGDLLLRGKWHAVTVGGAALGLELGLRLPSGHQDDLHGSGSVGVIPAAIVSEQFGPAGIHLEVGVDVDGDHVDDSRARYRLAGTLHLLDWLGFTAEIVGSSGLGTRDIHLEGYPTQIVRPREDVVDGVYEFEVTLFGRWSGYAGVDVPVTTDGLRPDVAPVVGLTVVF